MIDPSSFRAANAEEVADMDTTPEESDCSNAEVLPPSNALPQAMTRPSCVRAANAL